MQGQETMTLSGLLTVPPDYIPLCACGGKLVPIHRFHAAPVWKCKRCKTEFDELPERAVRVPVRPMGPNEPVLPRGGRTNKTERLFPERPVEAPMAPPAKHWTDEDDEDG
jgi:hypothetical protein